MLYATFYQLNWTAPATDLVLVHTDDLLVAARRFAPRVATADATVRTETGSAFLTPTVRAEQLPESNYLVIQSLLPFPVGSAIILDKKAWHSEIAALLELRWPGLLGRRVWQNLVHRPNEFLVVGDGPMRLTAGPDPGADDLQQSFNAAWASIEALAVDAQSRFRLASRWFGRAIETASPIDRLLYFYICLEVFPAQDTTDVPGAVSRYVHTHIAPQLSVAEVKERIGIGRIAGKRADIVHDGLAVVDVTQDREFDLRLQQAEALTKVCLRSLAGLPIGDDLNRYLNDPPPA